MVLVVLLVALAPVQVLIVCGGGSRTGSCRDIGRGCGVPAAVADVTVKRHWRQIDQDQHPHPLDLQSF